MTKIILPFGLVLDEASASNYYHPTSAEFKSRDKFDFVRGVGETWSDTNIYQGVILFPQVCELSQEILKNTFKFTKAQI